MRICRFTHSAAAAQFGRIDGASITPLGTDSLQEVVAGRTTPQSSLALDSVQLLAPLRPGKIIGVGRNYADHARELGNEVPTDPLLFFKPPSSVQNPGGAIVLPAIAERVDFEGELAVIIGRTARNVAAEEWREIVFGYSCANDVTSRDLQKKDVQFTRAKGFDTFCPLGPWIETELDPSDLRLVTRLNGVALQEGKTSDMIFTIPTLIAAISAFLTLEPGDVILTGTPAGVAKLKPGDVVEVEIEGIGTLSNPVTS